MRNIYIMLIATTALLTSCNGVDRSEATSEAAAGVNPKPDEEKDRGDADFVYNVVEANYAEIKLAEMGNQKTKDPGVRKIAQMLVADHTASLKALKTLAEGRTIIVPVEETEASRRRLEKLAGESAKDFSREWCNEMKERHAQNIATLEERMQETRDAELRNYINKTLPILKKHLEELEACEARLKGPSR